MPELPEVETVRSGLAPDLEGAHIDYIKTSDKKLRNPYTENMAGLINGRKIRSLTRRSKYLIINLDGGFFIVSHLGMSGSWRLHQSGDDAPKDKIVAHDHVILGLNKDGKNFEAIYNDPRRFGFFTLERDINYADYPAFKKLGIEPLGNALSGDYLRHAFKNKKAPLKALLLDQSIIAGLGNIYVCESLWRAGLSPQLSGEKLADGSDFAVKKSEALAIAIRDVIVEAIKAGGSTLRDYRHADGSLGYFQHNFAVYGRENQPCTACGSLISRLVQSGRSTFYCASCQDNG
ncbi:bifunctional DNA-formamidopyrimidine glycosylase/DNA-(apurinic or apyrimidinic site) lyase [Bartonella sp. HY329]|uniref:bifunctional DNA-formamidopyrimidine glycosylase/DNA-(apurinic or apyrimidinic site) lyase n=1 Tax=unclassified Bartonella TaxID=2645622 RepID=UPI0021C96743|nr:MULTISPECIES: bifunctional DNA-formamidopyrimidine glycosylase/DNA-(apurinic or apyrimidinic site) lyase [unclassified Bartonella]UXM95035.1 bifunctional DNA-formamidopyrimidine glycosylase/DNA-(apurinic or apyrimidinic site) lyase [Bartonella sp. HY329]UXN09358.1 bifunctional DNA-formamidopyrimidine glycosylase/DNA-(apurinic or apyrimidinic site) lyase [Bartonella sp. HY328]